jgi:rare lipoprotein A
MKRIILTSAVFFTVVFLAGAQTLSEGAIFRQEGIASWYGTEFAGRPTSSGEIFNPALLTAAHLTLPFGTFLRVTNTQNNKQVIVRINDRGPHVPSRIIDISQAAAEQLDMVSTGTAPVVVESLTPLTAASPAQSPRTSSNPGTVPLASSAPYQPASSPAPRTAPTSVPAASDAVKPPAQAAPAPVPSGPPVPLGPPVPEGPPAIVETPAQAGPVAAPGTSPASAFPTRPVTAPQPPRSPVGATVLPSLPPTGTGKQYRVQVGAFRVARYAAEAFDKLKNMGLNPAYERYEENYRVVLSGISPEQIPTLAEQLGTAGFPEILVREER